MTTTTRIEIEETILGVLVSTEVEIAYLARYDLDDIEPLKNESYADSEIFLIDDKDEVELCPKKDKVLFDLAEQIIVDWVIENMDEKIEESVIEDCADQAENAALRRTEF